MPWLENNQKAHNISGVIFLEKHLYKSLEANKEEIRGWFTNSVDYFEKDIEILGHRATLIMCEDLTDITNLWQVNLKPLNVFSCALLP